MVGILVWLVVGGVVGWLASMVMRTNAQQGIILNIIVGIVGAFLAGLLLGGGSINNAITNNPRAVKIFVRLCQAPLEMSSFTPVRNVRFERKRVVVVSLSFFAPFFLSLCG